MPSLDYLNINLFILKQENHWLIFGMFVCIFPNDFRNVFPTIQKSTFPEN